MIAGEITAGAGVAGAVLGITLWSIGGAKVRVHDTELHMPTFAVGPGSAQLSMKF
jgi:hypothetical protein